MEVILLDKVVNLGNLGDQVKVKDGYARNFLIPKGKAVPANKKNIEYFETRRTELEMKLATAHAAAEICAAKINKLVCITIKSKAGVEGKLFGSIGARDIANVITASGINVTKNQIRLHNGVLRTTGNHTVNIQIYNNIVATLNIKILPENNQKF